MLINCEKSNFEGKNGHKLWFSRFFWSLSWPAKVTDFKCDQQVAIDVNKTDFSFKFQIFEGTVCAVDCPRGIAGKFFDSQ